MTSLSLPSVEAISFPRDHTFSALERTQGSSSPLSELYGVIHGRPPLKDAARYLSIPTLAETSDKSRYSVSETIDNLPLSVVITSRNDTHVERMEDRTQACIDGIYYLANTTKTKVELLIIEWNPPKDRPSMTDQFTFPATDSFVSTRIITIPAAIHQTYSYANNLPLYQMIAKNIGIRRARGQFILVTNVDILLSEELFRFITSTDLEAGKLYRADRWDVDRNILDEETVEEMINLSPERVLNINSRQGAVGTENIWPVWNSDKKSRVIQNYTWFPNLHTEGCGDFHCMDRDSWLKIGGYCEVDAFSMHIDSLFALTCYHAGITEIDLASEYRHYHLDHSLGQEIKPAVYLTRDKTELKHPSMSTLYNLHACMGNLGEAYAFNEDAWGMADKELPNAMVTQASWESSANPPYRILKGKSGCRVSMQDLWFEDFIHEFLKDWLETAWNATADYLRAFHNGKNLILWGTGGRGRHTISELKKRGLEISSIIDDHMVPLSKDAYDYPVLSKNDLNSSVLENSFIIVTSIFAENIRPYIERIGAKEGTNYLVSL